MEPEAGLCLVLFMVRTCQPQIFQPFQAVDKLRADKKATCITMIVEVENEKCL